MRDLVEPLWAREVAQPHIAETAKANLDNEQAKRACSIAMRVRFAGERAQEVIAHAPQ
jgi:hypothetical protein